jgi:hypothetical protein
LSKLIESMAGAGINKNLTEEYPAHRTEINGE